VRKQYHLRPSGPAFDAWDVHRLIRLSAGLPVRCVPLDRIPELDTAYWALPGAPHPTVRELVVHLRLVLAADPAHPVILGSDGRLMDGMHRIALALLEGRTEVAAVRFDVDPEPDHRDVHPEDLSYDEDPEF
jgi:hypothetical protein